MESARWEPSMKARPETQRKLLELQDIDLRLGRSRHRARVLQADNRIRDLAARIEELANEMIREHAGLLDLDRAIARTEDDVARVRQRATRDRDIAASGVGAREQLDLQNELDSLVRRQRELEDAELELLQRQEDLGTSIAAGTTRLETLKVELAECARVRDGELVELTAERRILNERRSILVAEIPLALLELYDRARGAGGIGAAELEGDRCGGCRLDLAPMEAARIRSAAADEVEMCEECGCVLAR